MRILFILEPREKNYQTYLRYLFSANEKHSIGILLASQPVYFSKLKGEWDAIITSANAILHKMPGVDSRATTFQYQGSLFVKEGIDVLIVDSFKALAWDMSYTLRLKHYVAKLTSPWLFPKQPELVYEFWDKVPDNFDKDLWLDKEPLFIAADIETSRHDLGMTLCGYTFVYPDFSMRTVVIPHDSEIHHKAISYINRTKYPKVFHNGIYDNTYFIRWGCPVTNYCFDTQYMFQSWIHDWKKSLDFISVILIRNAVWWKDGRKSTSPREKIEYNARDCYYTALSFQALCQHMPEWAWETFQKKIRRAHICLYMNIKGMVVDEDVYNTTGDEFLEEQVAATNKLLVMVGNPNYNPRSPKQNKQFLQILAGKRLKVTNADEKAQNKVKELGAIEAVFVEQLQTVIKLGKLHSTYFKWEPMDGRLLYSVNPSSTTSDRFGCTSSDFWCGQQTQNFPAIARKPIVANPGKIMGSCDLPQSESRFTAYESQDESLIHAVENAKDFHTYNATMFFGLEEAEITPELRTLSKPINHGSNYNMGPGVLLDTMGAANVLKAKGLLRLPNAWSMWKVCEHLLSLFKEAYPRIKGSTKVPLMKSWYGDLIQEATKYGKVVAGDGWTKMIFGDPIKNKLVMNNLASVKPQHDNAEYTHRALERIYYELVKYGEFDINLELHDEIIFECDTGKEEFYSQKIVDLMTEEWEINGRKFKVVPGAPIWGNSWYDIH